MNAQAGLNILCSCFLQLEYGSDKGNAEASEEECRKFYCESCAFVSRELEGEVVIFPVPVRITNGRGYMHTGDMRTQALWCAGQHVVQDSWRN